MERHLVSIVVPCYNVGEYLSDCLDSLINQTFKDIEIICVNDGSTDKTPQILDNYAKKDLRIKIVTQENKGLSGARNTGVKNSSGEYITFVDSDDWVSENYIEKLYDGINRNNADIAASTIVRWRKNYQKYRVHYTEEKVYETIEDKINTCSIPKCCYVWNKLYKAELVKKYSFTEGVYYEDMLWTPNILKQSNRMVVIPDISYFYRVNKNSIVKKKQSLKKQLDSYKAHKYIIQFFKGNHISIPPKYEQITRRILYFLDFPIVKIKEYENKEHFYLFGFIPVCGNLFAFIHKIFSISDIDGHRMIYIFGLQIRKKYQTAIAETILKEKGINETKRNPNIILSLTTFPDRINTVSKTIKTLLNQTLKPDKVVLWLAESQFPQKEKELPQELLNLRDFGLDIDWCDDIRSYKKLIPALEKYPNDIIITFDDDIYYDRDVVENLYNSYLTNPNYVHANRGHRIDVKNNMIKPKKNSSLYWTKYLTPSYKNTIIGCGGVLYPPNSLHSMTTDRNMFQKVIPTQDDLWFWAMALLNRTKIQIVSSYDMQIKTVENTQHCGLCKLNNNISNGINGKDGFKIISKTFPEIVDIIKGEEDA